MRSYWTFLAAYDDEGANTPNAYYFDPHAHYWSRQDAKLIVGGETRRCGRQLSAPPASMPRWRARALVGETSRASRAASRGRCTTACSARRATTAILGRFSDSSASGTPWRQRDGQSTLSCIAYSCRRDGFARPSAEEEALMPSSHGRESLRRRPRAAVPAERSSRLDARLDDGADQAASADLAAVLARSSCFSARALPRCGDLRPVAVLENELVRQEYLERLADLPLVVELRRVGLSEDLEVRGRRSPSS